MKIVLRIALHHPIAFVRGVYRGFKKVYKNHKNPNYVAPSAEVREYTIKKSLEKLETLI